MVPGTSWFVTNSLIDLGKVERFFNNPPGCGGSSPVAVVRVLSGPSVSPDASSDIQGKMRYSVGERVVVRGKMDESGVWRGVEEEEEIELVQPTGAIEVG